MPRKPATPRKASRTSGGLAPPPRPPGAPTKLTPEIQDTICLVLRNGNFVEVAAAFAGISKDTLYAWLRKGARSKSGPYRAFSDAVKKAMAVSEIGLTGIVQTAARGQLATPDVIDEQGRVVKAAQPAIPPVWQAAAWHLERMYPERYARRLYKVEEPPPRGGAEAQEEVRSSGGGGGLTIYLPAEDPLPAGDPAGGEPAELEEELLEEDQAESADAPPTGEQVG